MNEATAKRADEAAAFKSESEETKADLAGVKGSVADIAAGTGGSFLQTALAGTLRRIVSNNKNIDENDRDTVMAFLSGAGEDEAPSDQITGILKTMQDEMSSGLKDAEATEAAAIKDYEGLMAAKAKEADSLQ